MEFYEPQKYKIFTFWRGWMGVLCCLSIFQIANQSFSNLRFHTFEILILLLWWFTPTFTIRWFNIAWIPMNIVLILFLPLIVILSCREYKIFWPRKYLFPAERILCSIREYTSFFTRIHFILVRNVVGSRIEHKILSAGNKYFPGLKILCSRQ